MEKISGLRIFEDNRGKMNLCVGAAGGDFAKGFYELFVARFRERGLRVETGVFGSDMYIRIVNSGPVTLLLDSSKKF